MSVLEALVDLLDAALVQRVETGDGTARFGLPEALRQLASEMLDHAPDGQRWRHAHAQRQYELVWALRFRFVDRKTYLAAHAAEREAGAALRWATATHDPLEQPLAAAFAVVLLDGGRVREGGAIIERLTASPSADPEVRFVVLFAHSAYLGSIGRLDDSLRVADEAYRAAPDDKARSQALILRGLSSHFAGYTAEALTDHAEATALAREVNDPVLLACALASEAQALTGARLLDEAAARLDEARMVGSPVDANLLYYEHTAIGDLALANGRPADALEPYARSLEQALGDGMLDQISVDLFTVAEALAALGHDAEALEVAGMADSQEAEIGTSMGPPCCDHLAALEQRLGPTRTAELKRRARATGPAERVARACELARSHAPAPTAPRD
jgi:tetratricopeptide (TPR) repeat protein